MAAPSRQWFFGSAPASLDDLIDEAKMIHLSRETEALAHQLATAKGLSLDDAVTLAIEQYARAIGITRAHRRQTVSEMLAVGAEIAAMPVLDPRSPRQIMDDVNAE